MDENGHLYKGMTNNIHRRLAEHKSGKTKTTARMSGLRLVYSERFPFFEDARNREVYFKTAAGRRFIKERLNKGG